MVLRRTNGFHGIGQLRDEVDRLVGDLFGGSSAAQRLGNTGRTFPAINVWEKADSLFVEAELPGLKSDDVEISVVGNELTLKGRREDMEQEGVSYHRRERGVGDFTRLLRLPVEVDSENVQASLRDGVLLITLPKAPAARPRKIQVSAGQ